MTSSFTADRINVQALRLFVEAILSLAFIGWAVSVLQATFGVSRFTLFVFFIILHVIVLLLDLCGFSAFVAGSTDL